MLDEFLPQSAAHVNRYTYTVPCIQCNAFHVRGASRVYPPPKPFGLRRELPLSAAPTATLLQSLEDVRLELALARGRRGAPLPPRCLARLRNFFLGQTTSAREQAPWCQGSGTQRALGSVPYLQRFRVHRIPSLSGVLAL